MRIQHNIAALNSHRQLGNNNNAVSKNLEKLSSGYRINRAGDDAISEKMRAQITGIDASGQNALDFTKKDTITVDGVNIEIDWSDLSADDTASVTATHTLKINPLDANGKFNMTLNGEAIEIDLSGLLATDGGTSAKTLGISAEARQLQAAASDCKSVILQTPSTS